jgi:Transposase DDE domain
MHQRIVNTIAKLRQDVATHLASSTIHQICDDIGHVWRSCVLEPATIVHVFLLQILNGNTALNHLRHLAGLDLTAQAFCEARKRLPLDVFRRVLTRIVPALRDTEPPSGLWHGHRTFAVDGSSFSMPDTPELQAHFGQPGGQRKGCGFPVARFLALFDSATGFLLDVLAAPLRTHDMSRVAELHPELRAGDLLVGDRGFCSFAHVALLALRGVHSLFRLHQRLQHVVPPLAGAWPPAVAALAARRRTGRSLGRVLRRLGVADHVVEWHRPARPPDWMTPQQFSALPEVLICRIITYSVLQPGYRTRQITLLCTLLDAGIYPWHELADLFRRRWQVETNFWHIKITLKMDVVHCKTVEGVLKELMVFALAYNLVRVVMVEAAVRRGVEVDRVSFVDALRWLLSAGGHLDLDRVVVNPDRPGRVQPRVRKRRPKEYPLMQEPRSVLRKRLLTQKLAS